MTSDSRLLLARFMAWMIPGFAPHILGNYRQGIVTGSLVSLIYAAATFFSESLAVWSFSSVAAISILLGSSLLCLVIGEIYFRLLRPNSATWRVKPVYPPAFLGSWLVNGISVVMIMLFSVAFTVQIIRNVGIFIIFDKGMEPVLSQGDLIVSRNNRPAAAYNRGDLIIFRHPTERRILLKRLVALPGDTVTFKDGYFRNEAGFERRYLTKAEGRQFESFEDLTIKEDCYLVLGDDLHESKKDSLSFGCLTTENFVAYPRFILFSKDAAKMGREL